ncbi:MAG: hypothetical protein ACHQHP_06135, partial [Bacteroidia bacterium]
GVASSNSPISAQTLKTSSIGMSIVQNGKELKLSKDTSANMTFFSGTLAEGKVYLHWNVAGERSNGTYIVYRSSDAKNYQVVGYKDGVGVPINQDIAYYFTDETPASGENSYIVFHLGDNKTFLTSEIIRVEKTNEILMSKANTK